MSLRTSWGHGSPFSVGKPRAIGKGVYQLLRPKSLAEVNHFRPTPYTERVCWGCRKKLYDHWYLVFLDNLKCSRLYCYRDGTAYHTKEKFRI